MPASHLHPITDVANPVIERPASSAHAGVAAVISDARAPHRERLGERVGDLGSVELHRGSAATVRAGSSSHGSRTG